MNQTEVREALRHLILGSGVRRGSHQLILDGTDTTQCFLELLVEEGFRPFRVDEINIEAGERVPAFYVEGGVAHFGWVFWEMFFPGRMRKIYGSVVRDEKGDWAIIVGKGRKQQVYANLSLKEEMDLEHPSAF